MHIRYPHSFRRNAQMLALGAFCLATSLFIGIQTAADIAPMALIEAGGSAVTGDMDGNGSRDINDVTAVLEVIRGYASVTPQMLKADPNADGVITIDDALRILSILSLR